MVTTLFWSYIAKEWWLNAGVAKTTARAVTPAAIARTLRVRLVIAAPDTETPNYPGNPATQLLKDICNRRGKLFFRLLPARFEELLPVLGPRTTIVIDEPRVGVGDLTRTSVGVEDVAQALNIVVPAFRRVRCRDAIEAERGSDRDDERFRVVEDRLVIEPGELAVLHHRLERLDCLHLRAALEHRVRKLPRLDVGGPRYERGAVPETDRFAKPLRRLLHVRLLADHHLTQEVVGDARDELNVPRGHRELEISCARRLRPPADEPFGPAERRAPLRRVGDRLVVGGLNHVGLVLRREQCQHGRGLRDTPDPLGAAIGLAVPLVVTVPIGHGGFRVDRRPALGLGRSHQRFVMFLRRLVRIRAHDSLARPVLVAVAPRGGFLRLRADATRVPHRVQLPRRVAAVIPLVQPVRAVLIEVLRGEQIYRKRRDSLGRPLNDDGPASASPTLRQLPDGGAPSACRRALLCRRVALREDARQVDVDDPDGRGQNGKGQQGREPSCSHADFLLVRLR